MYKIGGKAALDVVMKKNSINTPVTLEFERSGTSSLSDDEPSIARVPRVVAESVVYLETHGLLIEGVFRVNGDLKKAEQLLEAFASKSNVDLESLGDDGSSVRSVRA